MFLNKMCIYLRYNTHIQSKMIRMVELMNIFVALPSCHVFVRQDHLKSTPLGNFYYTTQ